MLSTGKIVLAPFSFRQFSAAVVVVAAFVTASWAADPTYVSRLLAGSGDGPGLHDSIGRAARFTSPANIAVDDQGNLYVSAFETVRRVSPTGRVTTIAGATGEPGSEDGPLLVARFRAVAGLAVDKAGNIYLADVGNHTIRVIKPTGVVATLAGSPGNAGSADGVGNGARFNAPADVAVDTNGNVFVADRGNRTVRKITSAGSVTTIAGAAGQQGTTDAPTGGRDAVLVARFHSLIGVEVDGVGNVYVSDGYNRAIRKITAGGVVTTLAVADIYGTRKGGSHLPVYNWIGGLAVDSAGSVYLADTGRDHVAQVAADGTMRSVAGGNGLAWGFLDGPVSLAQFYEPQGGAVDVAGNIYVADTGNHAIRKIAREDRAVTTLAGGPAEPGADDAPGEFARFQFPQDAAVDSSGNIYIADTGNHTVRKIAYTGGVETLAGSPGSSETSDGVSSMARFYHPAGVIVDKAGHVYVADRGNHTVRKITADGVVTTLAGSAGNPGAADGVGKAARFNGVSDVALDSAGNLYASDTENHTIRKITAQGVVTTYAGLAGNPGAIDGDRSEARFDQPGGIGADDAGNVYVCDLGRGSLRKITPDGVVTTYEGSRYGLGATRVAVDSADNLYVSRSDSIVRLRPDGTWFSIWHSSPPIGDPMLPQPGPLRPSGPGNGLAVDSRGRLFLADTAQHSIRIVEPAGTNLVNLSARTLAGTGNNVTIGGFVIAGQSSKRVLIRAVGPSLTSRGIDPSEAMRDPVIEVHDIAGATIAANDDWSQNDSVTEIASVSMRVGASQLASPSDQKSATLLATLTPGAYTFVVRSKDESSGVVLAEIYDADIAGGANLTNISTRVRCTTGSGVAITGFVISGNSPKRLLIRAVGPSLTRFGLEQDEVLPDPMIEVHAPSKQNAVVAANDDWSPSNLAEVTARVGAAPFSNGDAASSALVVTLPAGAYTVVTRGKRETSGIVLLELYDAD